MTGELFLASVLFAAGCSVTVYLLLSARINRRADNGAGVDEFDLTPIETRLADLVTDMNRVANSHTQAIADRRDELKRVIEMANDRIRRLNTQLADLAILEQRIRDPRRAVNGADAAASAAADAAADAVADANADRGADAGLAGYGAGRAGDRGIGTIDTIVEDEVPRGRRASGTGRRRGIDPAGTGGRGAIERSVNGEGGAWIFEAPGPVDGQQRDRDIESLAADGLSPAAIASRLRLPIHAVERVLAGRERH